MPMRKSAFVLLLAVASAFACPARGQRQLDGRVSARTPPQRAGEGVLDGSFVAPQNAGANINEGYAFVAQTYTAGVTGRLLGVNIDVRSKRGLNPEAGFPVYPLHVALHKVVGGVPGATLGEVTLPTDEATLSSLIKFPKRIAQVKGRQYAIVVNYVGAPSSGADRWLGVWAGAVGRIEGEMFAGPDGETWPSSFPDGVVLRFRTYVAPRTRPLKAARRR